MSETHTIRLSDYSLVGKDSQLAIEKGLADADWYTSPVSKDQLRKLLERRDWPALRDEYLSKHPDPTVVEYYLCGPPLMIDAARTLLDGLGVPKERIACDEF